MIVEDQLHDIARGAATALLFAEADFPFGPDIEVYRIGGKIFMLMSRLRGLSCITVKCDPLDAQELRHRYPEITPGYHMNKRHWVTVLPGDGIDAELVQDLVKHAYQTAAAGIPKIRRPLIEPITFTSAFFAGGDEPIPITPEMGDDLD